MKKVKIAFLWNFVGKMLVRCMGIISTLILVRLLMPADFGLIAIGVMVVGLFEVLSNSGVNRYLIVIPTPSEDDYNAAWTLKIIMRATAVFACIILAPYIADYMNDDRITGVIQILSSLQLITIFSNIGIVKFEKEINFAPQNKILIMSKLLTVASTILAAYIFKNYYALLIGSAVNVILTTVGTYVVCDFKPKFRFQFPKGMANFSIMIMIRNIVSYSRSQLDTLMIGNLFGVNGTGQFNVARQFAILPKTEMIDPATGPLFSMISNESSESTIISKFYKLVFISYSVILPCAFGLLAAASAFTAVVLGDKWLYVASFIGTLGFITVPFTIQSLLIMLYDRLGAVSKSFFSEIIAILLLISFVTFLSIDALEDFVEVRIIVALLATLTSMVIARKYLPISIRQVMISVSLPLFCSILMYIALSKLNASMTFHNSFEELAVLTLAGATTYLTAYAMSIYTAKRLFKTDRFDLAYKLLKLRGMKDS